MAVCSSCCRRTLHGSAALQEPPPRQAAPLPLRLPCSKAAPCRFPLRRAPRLCLSLRRSAAAAAAAAPPGEAPPTLQDALGNLAALLSEAREERRAVAECMARTAQEAGRAAEDYGRRAEMFARIGAMAASSKTKGELVAEALEALQSEILEHDLGLSAEDYWLRAEVFQRSAQVFGGRDD